MFVWITYQAFAVYADVGGSQSAPGSVRDFFGKLYDDGFVSFRVEDVVVALENFIADHYGSHFLNSSPRFATANQGTGTTRVVIRRPL